MYRLVKDSAIGLLFWVDDQGRLIVGDQSAKDNRAGKVYGPDYCTDGILYVDPLPFEKLIKEGLKPTKAIEKSGFCLPVRTPEGAHFRCDCTWDDLVWVFHWYKGKSDDKK